MRVIAAIMRIYSYIFHLVFALLLLAIAFLTISTGAHNLNLGALPWEGKALTYWLLGLSLLGIVIVLMAIKGVMRIAFVVWSLIVLGFLLRAWVFSSYAFPSWDSFLQSMYVIAGALLAAIGAWYSYKQQRKTAR